MYTGSPNDLSPSVEQKSDQATVKCGLHVVLVDPRAQTVVKCGLHAVRETWANHLSTSMERKTDQTMVKCGLHVVLVDRTNRLPTSMEQKTDQRDQTMLKCAHY